MTRPSATREERLWAGIETLPEIGCWLFSASSKTVSRYGAIRYFGRIYRAHRFSWETYIGPIPDGIKVLHKCDIGFCVNPDHLFLGTQAENVQDMLIKGRGNKAAGLRNGRHTKPHRTCRGAAHPSSHLTEADVIAIRSSPKSCRKLGEQYGVSKATIHRIKQRKTWSHIA